MHHFSTIAEALLAEAEQNGPLRFFAASATDDHSATWQARTIACHGLTSGQVMARLVRHDADLRGQAVEAVLAVLLHDVGMIRVPRGPRLRRHSHGGATAGHGSPHARRRRTRDRPAEQEFLAGRGRAEPSRTL